MMYMTYPTHHGGDVFFARKNADLHKSSIKDTDRYMTVLEFVVTLQLRVQAS